MEKIKKAGWGEGWKWKRKGIVLYHRIIEINKQLNTFIIGLYSTVLLLLFFKIEIFYELT